MKNLNFVLACVILGLTAIYLPDQLENVVTLFRDANSRGSFSVPHY